MGLTFLTGFPGFLATSFVRTLVERDPEVAIVALVEPRMADRARQVAAEVAPGSIEVLPGDIGERRLGIPAADYERLEAEMSAAFHFAALYNLAVPLETAQRVNVDGTGNVIELCARGERLERLNYVSTAYVAGTRTGVVYEHELSLGQGFKNHYESTKFQAEVWVRAAMANVPTTIYRPGIVVGDSRTGRTQKFDGPYYLLRMISLLTERGLPLPRLLGRAPFNVVPVDFVIDALAAGATDPGMVGETLHLVDPDPLETRELFAILAREYAGQEPSALPVPGPILDAGLRFRLVRRTLADTPRESVRYLTHSVRFDTRKAGDLVARHHLPSPRFRDAVGPIVRFFREHESDPSFAPG